MSALNPRYFCPAYVPRKSKRLLVSALDHAKQDLNFRDIEHIIKHASQKLSR